MNTLSLLVLRVLTLLTCDAQQLRGTVSSEDMPIDFANSTAADMSIDFPNSTAAAVSLDETSGTGGTEAAPMLQADEFVPYFNYGGDLAVTGKVNVEESTNGQTLSWDLAGLDPKCEGGPGAKPNSCGVHIHEGKSCKEDALGHYYATAEDPWKTITYTSKKSSTGLTVAQMSAANVPTGLTDADVTGRTFIVHDFEGARVSCSLLTWTEAGNLGSPRSGGRVERMNSRPENLGAPRSGGRVERINARPNR